MKKIGSIIIVVLLFFSIGYIPVLGQQKSRISSDDAISNTSSTYEDELDQSMTEFNNIMLPIGHIPSSDVNLSIQIAQSFIPTKEVLTRVEVYLLRNTSTTYPLSIGIREELTAPDLVDVNIQSSSVPTDSFSWIEGNFDDIWVTVGHTYYLVCTTENITDNWYLWGLYNDSDMYPQGCAWVSLDDGNSWSNNSLSLNPSFDNFAIPQTPHPHTAAESKCDMCFKTYGIQETTLQITWKKNLLGPTFIIKNIGNISAYDVNWTLTMTGGILNRINISISGHIPELSVDQEAMIKIGKLVFGFGPVRITAKAHAVNAQEVSVTIPGFLVFIFFIPSLIP